MTHPGRMKLVMRELMVMNYSCIGAKNLLVYDLKEHTITKVAHNYREPWKKFFVSYSFTCMHGFCLTRLPFVIY